MWGGVRGLPAVVLAVVSSTACCSACGGGGDGSGVQPPPSQPDFLLGAVDELFERGARSDQFGRFPYRDKQASVTFKDMNTLSIVTPALSQGPQQLVLSNPDGESVALDAAFFAQ
jgi:hypothetical protein